MNEEILPFDQSGTLSQATFSCSPLVKALQN